METPAVFCLSLVLWGLLGESTGIPVMPKDKRGWTLNSVGYLLGPHAHHPLMDKGPFPGKREAVEELQQLGVELKGLPPRAPSEHSLQPLLGFLSFPCLPESGALDHLPLFEATSRP